VEDAGNPGAYGARPSFNAVFPGSRQCRALRTSSWSKTRPLPPAATDRVRLRLPLLAVEAGPTTMGARRWEHTERLRVHWSS
jgi:hypothetical protein